MAFFKARTDILPAAQIELWEYLKDVPKDFVLYGGTAVALRYGHRQSVDFDFFSTDSDPDVSATTDKLPFIRKFSQENSKELLQTDKGTSQVIYNLQMSNMQKVQLTFVRDASWIGGAAKKPQTVAYNGIKIASPVDLMATKIDAAIRRAQAKDFIDIAQMLLCKVSFATALAALFAIRKSDIPAEISDINAFFDNISLNGEEYIADRFANDKSCTRECFGKIPEIHTVLKNAIEATSLAAVIKKSKTVKICKDLSFEKGGGVQ